MAALLATALIGRLPQAMSALALVRVALDADHGYSGAGVLTTTYVLASTVGLPLLGRVIDRSGRRRAVLLGASLASATAFVATAFSVQTSLLVAAVCAGLAGLVAPPLEPALRGIWPRIARPGPQLQRVFAADVAVQEVLFILGPLVTALVVAAADAQAAVVSMGVLTVLGTVLFCVQPATGTSTTGGVAASRAQGGALRPAPMRVLVVVLVLAGLPVGVLTISATRFAALAGAQELAGWGLAANATGALIGALAIARLRRVPNPARALPVLLAALGVLYLPTAWLSAPTAIWLAAALISGLALPPLLTQVFALVVRFAPDGAETEANAWVVSGFSVGIAAGTLGAGLATGATADGGAAAAVLAPVLTAGAALLARAGILRD